MSVVLSDQLVLVTGASSGIGAAVALLCNACGAKVIANGRDERRLEALRAQSEYPDAFFIEPRDLLDEIHSLPQWVSRLKDTYGKLSALVPCAGEACLVPLRQYEHAEALRIFDLNFHIPLLLAKSFADRRNSTSKGASIVFLSSAAASAKESGLCVYGGAKKALETATEVLSKELAKQQIRVNALAPALVRTPMGEAYLSFLPQEVRDKEVTAYSFGVCEAHDIAEAVVFLLSAAARRITGQVIIIDGGRY